MRFLRTASSRWLLLAAVFALPLVAAGAYLSLAQEEYDATAKLQVTPVPRSDTTFTGFTVFRESEEASAAETAAALVETSGIAAAAATRLRADPDDLLDAVRVEADDDSNTVSVRARSEDPRRAAQIANAFVGEFVSQRAARFQAELTQTIEMLRRRLRSVPSTRRDEPPARMLSERLAALEGYVGQPDPTVTVVSDAVAPSEQAWPRPLRVIGAALAVSSLLAAALLLAPMLAARRHQEPAVARRERGVEEHTRALRQRERELSERSAELAVRERGLEERERRLEAVEREQAERDGSLAAWESALRERESIPVPVPPAHELEPEPEPVVEPEPEEPELPEPVVAAAAPPSSWSTANLITLERLVAEHGASYPDRLDEWHAFLFQLRSHADNEGQLPRSFDALVEEVFGELLER